MPGSIETEFGNVRVWESRVEESIFVVNPVVLSPVILTVQNVFVTFDSNIICFVDSQFPKIPFWGIKNFLSPANKGFPTGDSSSSVVSGVSIYPSVFGKRASYYSTVEALAIFSTKGYGTLYQDQAIQRNDLKKFDKILSPYLRSSSFGSTVD